MQLTGQTAMHGASVQCMHATETDRSPGRPSLSVTTLRRLTPHGTSFSFLHAVTQALQSMQRSTSHRNRILAMSCPRDLTEARLRLLHHRHGVVAVRPRRVHGLAGDDRKRAFGVFVADDCAQPPARKVERHEHATLSDTGRDHCAYLD